MVDARRAPPAVTHRTGAGGSRRYVIARARDAPITLRRARPDRAHMLSRLVPITSSSSTFSTALLRRAPTPLAPRPPRRSPSTRSIAVAPIAMSSTLDTSGTPGETAVADVSATGAFVRKDAVFRSRITVNGPHPPRLAATISMSPSRAPGRRDASP